MIVEVVPSTIVEVSKLVHPAAEVEIRGGRHPHQEATVNPMAACLSSLRSQRQDSASTHANAERFGW
jgi:hypothetical protein